MKLLNEVLDFLEAPLVLELDPLREVVHEQRFLVETKFLTIEYTISVTTRDIAFGHLVVVQADILEFEFSVEHYEFEYEKKEVELLSELVYAKIERAVNDLME